MAAGSNRPLTFQVRQAKIGARHGVFFDEVIALQTVRAANEEPFVIQFDRGPRNLGPSHGDQRDHRMVMDDFFTIQTMHQHDCHLATRRRNAIPLEDRVVCQASPVCSLRPIQQQPGLMKLNESLNRPNRDLRSAGRGKDKTPIF